MVCSGLLTLVRLFFLSTPPSPPVSTSLDFASSRFEISRSLLPLYSFTRLSSVSFLILSPGVYRPFFAPRYDLSQTAFYYLADEKERESVARWSFGFVKTVKCAVCNRRCCNTNLQTGFQWLENTRYRDESPSTYRIGKGDQLNGQTKSSLTTALALSEIPVLISRLAIRS